MQDLGFLLKPKRSHLKEKDEMVTDGLNNVQFLL